MAGAPYFASLHAACPTRPTYQGVQPDLRLGERDVDGEGDGECRRDR